MDLLLLKCLLCIFFPLIRAPGVSLGSERVTVKPGEHCELHCPGLPNTTVQVLEWTRQDLGSEGYVLFYRSGKVLDEGQHSRFSDRVELKDPELKKGDLSVILQDVTLEDSGTYTCLYKISGETQERTHLVQLTVTEPGQEVTLSAAKVWGIVSGPVGVILLLICVFLLFKLKCCKNKNIAASTTTIIKQYVFKDATVKTWRASVK